MSTNITDFKQIADPLAGSSIVASMNFKEKKDSSSPSHRFASDMSDEKSKRQKATMCSKELKKLGKFERFPSIKELQNKV